MAVMPGWGIVAHAMVDGAKAIASAPGFEPGADLTGPPMADGRGLHRGTIMDVPYGAGVLGSGDRGAYEDEHGTIHWGSGELEGDWSPGEGGTSADAIYTYGSDGHLDPSLKPSGTTRTEKKSGVELVDPGPSGGIRGTYTPGTPYRYPYLIPSRYDFSGPAGMPYTRAYWEDAGLPMGLLSYEYPGTYGSGTGGILGSGGSVYRPPVDTGGVFGTGTGTGTGTGSPETGTLPTDGRTGDGKTGDGKPETDFERHYPDDRGHDVHRTSPIYDDRDFLGDARRSAERTSVLLSPYWDGPGDGLVDHLGETVPDYTGYSDAVGKAIPSSYDLDSPSRSFWMADDIFGSPISSGTMATEERDYEEPVTLEPGGITYTPASAPKTSAPVHVSSPITRPDVSTPAPIAAPAPPAPPAPEAKKEAEIVAEMKKAAGIGLLVDPVDLSDIPDWMWDEVDKGIASLPSGGLLMGGAGDWGGYDYSGGGEAVEGGDYGIGGWL